MRYKLSFEIRKRRIVQFLENVLRIRIYFWKHHQYDPYIICADQMPLHRNEVAGDKTMSRKGDVRTVFFFLI